MSENNVDTWNGLLTNYLKAENVEGEEAVVVCVNVKREGDRLDLVIDYNQERFQFSMNKTNMVFLKEEAKIQSPKEIIGKKITLKKTQAMNPQLKKEVPALRISKVE